MANAKITYKSFYGIPDNTLFEKLKSLYQELFDDADVIFFEKRLRTQQDVLIVMAFNDKSLIGFKIGFRYNANTFYSWVGGVDKKFRRIGVATRLAQIQEANSKESGYQKLRTKSMNRFKPMMLLNLKNGFDIVNVYTNQKEQTKIVFEKEIS